MDAETIVIGHKTHAAMTAAHLIIGPDIGTVGLIVAVTAYVIFLWVVSRGD